MNWFDFLFKPRCSNNPDSEPCKTFILESILTPSGIVDSLDDGPDVDTQENSLEHTDSDLDNQPFDNLSGNTLEGNELLREIPNEEIEEIPFIYVLEERNPRENEQEWAEVITQSQFDFACFVVSKTGEVQIDYFVPPQ